MYVHANQENAYRFIVVDLDKMELVPFCIWANDDTGVYCVNDSYRDKNKLYIRFSDLGNRNLIQVVKRSQIVILDPERPDDKTYLNYLASRLDKRTSEDCVGAIIEHTF